MTKFCSALYLENLLTNIFAKLNLRGGVSCMPAALLFTLTYSVTIMTVSGMPKMLDSGKCHLMLHVDMTCNTGIFPNPFCWLYYIIT